jgi:hypothetical protein
MGYGHGGRVRNLFEMMRLAVVKLELVDEGIITHGLLR